MTQRVEDRSSTEAPPAQSWSHDWFAFYCFNWGRGNDNTFTDACLDIRQPLL